MSSSSIESEKQKVHFLHIGKTGGSAIRSVLRDYKEATEYSLKLHGFFLRDPVSRFVSGFYSRQRKGQPRYYSEWDSTEEEVFERFKTPNELAVSLASEQSLAVLAMETGQHFCRYDNWYIDFDYFNSRLDDIFFIGMQENLEADFNKLKRILKIPQDANLPTDEKVAHRNPPNLDRSIDECGVVALKEWYADDIQFISVCKEFMSSKAI